MSRARWRSAWTAAGVVSAASEDSAPARSSWGDAGEVRPARAAGGATAGLNGTASLLTMVGPAASWAVGLAVLVLGTATPAGLRRAAAGCTASASATKPPPAATSRRVAALRRAGVRRKGNRGIRQSPLVGVSRLSWDLVERVPSGDGEVDRSGDLGGRQLGLPEVDAPAIVHHVGDGNADAAAEPAGEVLAQPPGRPGRQRAQDDLVEALEPEDVEDGQDRALVGHVAGRDGAEVGEAGDGVFEPSASHGPCRAFGPRETFLLARRGDDDVEATGPAGQQLQDLRRQRVTGERLVGEDEVRVHGSP